MPRGGASRWYAAAHRDDTAGDGRGPARRYEPWGSSASFSDSTRETESAPIDIP